jgi:hypothetical protein
MHQSTLDRPVVGLYFPKNFVGTPLIIAFWDISSRELKKTGVCGERVSR